MKRFITSLLALILCLNTVLSQDPIISMETSKLKTTKFTFLLRANTNTTVDVDFGNGVKVKISVSTTDNTKIENTLKGSSVKIYGSSSEITYLICLSQFVTSLDVTKASALYYLNCNDNLLTKLNISQNPNLEYLECNRNQLANLDVSDNIALKSIDCDNNLLTTLYVPNNSNLTLKCTKNQLNFATLPLEQTGWTYLYAPQQLISVAKDFNTEEEIDLSRQLTVNGKTTVYTWKAGTDELVKGTDYEITNGKTIFKKAPLDSVYCEMTNTKFPSLGGSNALRSSKIKIRKAITGLPIITMTTTKKLGKYTNLLFTLKANVETNVEVDLGDGKRIAYDIKPNELKTIVETIKGSTIMVYGSASEIIYLNCSNDSISSLNITNATALEQLDCSDNQLKEIEISKNIRLIYLECSNNQLTKLDISTNNSLNTMQCKNNYLTFATLPIKEPSAFINAPQKPISIAKDFKTGDIIDLSNQYLAGGNTTAYTWRTKSGTALALGTDYKITSGKTVFLKPQADSIYCEMTNASFPDFKNANVLKTTNTKVLTSGKQTQTITFDPLPNKKLNDAPFELTAKVNSNLPLTFTSSDPAIASVSGTTVTIHATGSVKVTVSQAGDNTWEAATAEQEFTITTVTGINEEKEFQLKVYPNPVTDILYIKGENLENTNASIYNLSGVKVWSGVVNQQSVNVSELSSGFYILKIIDKEKKERIIRFNKQ